MLIGLLTKLKNNKVTLLIFLSIFIIKIGYLIFILNFSFASNYTLASFKGDGIDYLGTSFNFINNGEYKSTFNDGVTEYVYRMPGMATILVPLLYLFSFSLAVKIFVLFQVLLLSIANTCLFMYLKNKCKYKLINVALFLFLSIGSYLNQYSNIILSETIAISLFIIIMCYLLQKKEFMVTPFFFVMCLLFTWLFFLRPFMIVFLPLICIKITDFEPLKRGVFSFIKTNKPVIMFVFVIAFSTGLWTLRNYIKTKEFIFLEYSVRTDKVTDFFECEPDVRNYIMDFGGNFYVSPYDSKTSHMLWFYPSDLLKRDNYERPSNSIFPPVIFGKGITIDSLENIRTTIDLVLKTDPKSAKRKMFFDKFQAQIKRADDVVLKNTNLLFKVKSKKDEALRFLYQPTQEITLSNSIVNKAFLYLNSFCNVFFITLLIIISFLSFLNSVNFKTYYYIYIPAVFMLLLYVAYFTSKENRGLFCYYPAFLIVGMNGLNFIQSNYKLVTGLKVAAIVCFTLLLGLYGAHGVK